MPEDPNERLQRLGLRPGPDTRPRCVHCDQPFDEHLASAGEFGLCDACLHDD